MTTNLKTRIAAIKAQCEEILKLSEKATAGPWAWRCEGNVLSPWADLVAPSRTVLAPRHDGNFGSELRSLPADREFIAHARNVSPAMARVVVQLIEYVEAETECADESCMCYDHKPAIAILERIANQWEGKP